MLWTVRADLPDRAGTLAGLARCCSDAGVDIRRLQVLPGPPGTGTVTDELVLDAPDVLDPVALAGLVGVAGGTGVLVTACTAAALADQPTRYVEAARAVLDQPTSFPEVVSRLFDADPGADPQAGGESGDVMDLVVGDVAVQLRRAVPFTATEQDRGLAIAALVSEVLGRQRPVGRPAARTGGPRAGADSALRYRMKGAVVEAVADEVVVGRATVGPAPGEEPGTRELELAVDADFRRRGIGTRLLGDAARLARGLGADELLVRTGAENRAVMAMVIAAGMRGRIRMAGDELTVRILLREVRPLAG